MRYGTKSSDEGDKLKAFFDQDIDISELEEPLGHLPVEEAWGTLGAWPAFSCLEDPTSAVWQGSCAQVAVVKILPA